jgi:hypothetical protein
MALSSAGGRHRRRWSLRLSLLHTLACDARYRRVKGALEGSFKGLPFLTIFGELNDPFGFQHCCRHLFPHAQQAIIADGNRFQMCDNPQMTAELIRSWHVEHVVPTLTGK